jgi:Tol biopolymer transport system component
VNLLKLSKLDLVVWGMVGVVVIILIALNQITNPANIGPTLAYLYPATGGLQQVWLAPINDPSQAQQLTNAPNGVFDFSVSPDGRYLAYSMRVEPEAVNEIMLMNLVTRQVTQVTNCVAESADCRSPEFRPTGGVIAYERASINTGIGAGMGLTRIWLADITTQPYATQPLYPDQQLIGFTPVWSGDGNVIAFYSADMVNRNIIIYTILGQDGQPSVKAIPSESGTSGALSPNGQRLVFPELSRRIDGSVYSHLRIADLNELQFVNLTQPEDNLDDIASTWNPDGVHIAITRRYVDERYTLGYQIYEMNVDSGEQRLLVEDNAYSHGFIEYDTSGNLLTMQRIPLNNNADGLSQPQVVVYDKETNTTTVIATNAFHPRWVVGEQAESQN